MSEADNTLSPAELKSLGNIRGAEYVYPERMQQIKAIASILHRTAESWGYAQVEGPTLQPVEFYKLKSSDELLNDGYYVNTPTRTYMLRPEMTPTIAYMLAETEKGLTYPVRWYSDPQIYRNERPQSGRRRQFGQFNLDRFDLAPMAPEARAFADAEVIAEAIDTLTRFGLSSDDIIVRINSRALLERTFDLIGISEKETRVALLAVIDAKEKLPEDVFVSKTIAAGINDNQSAALLEWLSINSLDRVADSPRFTSLAGTDEFKELQLLLSLLARHGYSDYVAYDPIIVRGLGYYTGTVFEAFDKKPELSMRRSVLGGGRYDNFTQKFGGKLDITGIGFGLGHAPLETVLESREIFGKAKPSGPDYYITVSEETAREQAAVDTVLHLSRSLRATGKTVVIDNSVNTLGNVRLKKQLSAANRAGAATALILQPDEILIVKDLETGDQEERTVESLINSLIS